MDITDKLVDIEKEKQFHNKIFESNERQDLDNLYSFANYIYENFESIKNAVIKTNDSVLEYGCGMKPTIQAFSNKSNNLFAFDISDYAINTNSKKITNVNFKVCDAHKLEYSDASFDVVFGSSILHHLNLDTAIAELKRVIKPNGKLLFLEPLGHNPFINKFRNSTPNLRSEDEHPLLNADLKLIEESFKISKTKYYCLFPLVVYKLFKNRNVKLLYTIARKIDNIIFSLFPFLRKYAWIVILIGEKKNLNS